MVMMVLKSLVLPVLAGGGLIALCWLLPPLRKWKGLSAAAFGLAIAVAGFGSWLAESGVPQFPPTEMAQWLGIKAIAAGLLAVLVILTTRREFPVPELTALIVGGLVAAGPTIARMAGGNRDIYFADMSMADHLGMGLAVAFGYLIFDRIAERRVGITLPLSFAIVFAGLALLADQAAWISLTFFCAAISGTCFIATIANRFGGSPSIGRGGVIAAILLIVVCPVAAYRQGYPEFPWWSLLLVAGSPLVLLPLEVKAIDKLPDWASALIRVGCVAILVALGLLYGMPGGEDVIDPMSSYQ